MAPSKKIESSAHIPDEIWDQIISKLGDERHLEPLSLVSKSFLSITNRHKQTLNLLSSNPEDLRRHLIRFPNLKHVSFSRFLDDPHPILHQLADSNLCLETLDLSDHKCPTLEELGRLHGSVLVGLKSFKLRGTCVSDDALDVIVKWFPNLEELDLSLYYDECCYHHYGYFDYVSSCGSCKVTEHGISTLVSSLKSLRKIDLSFREWVHDEHVILLADNCPSLEEIVLKCCFDVHNSVIRYVLKVCKKLVVFY